MSAQGSNVPDPAFAEALAAEEADRNLRLIQPASMPGRVMNGEPLPEPSSRRFAESAYQRFAEWVLKLSRIRWMVSAAGYCSAISRIKSANSGDERVGVTLVK